MKRIVVCFGRDGKCPSVEWNVLVDEDKLKIILECAACGNIKEYKFN